MPTKEVEKSREANRIRNHGPGYDPLDTGDKNKGQYEELNPPKSIQKPWEPKFKNEPEEVFGKFAHRGSVYLPEFMRRSTTYFGSNVRT